MARQKYYVVWKGRRTGIFENWEACQRQIRGFSGAQYKSFPSREVAEQAWEGDSRQFIGRKRADSDLAEEQRKLIGDPIPDSICVDAACSGAPGPVEYRGVYTRSGAELFREGPFEDGTNNIGEFLAIVHALTHLKKEASPLPLYSDSKIAIGWVRAKRTRTKLKRTVRNQHLFERIERAEQWLEENTCDTVILFWSTKAWGDIPADYGRK